MNLMKKGVSFQALLHHQSKKKTHPHSHLDSRERKLIKIEDTHQEEEKTPKKE